MSFIKIISLKKIIKISFKTFKGPADTLQLFSAGVKRKSDLSRMILFYAISIIILKSYI
jgi:hypothetical protein